MVVFKFNANSVKVETGTGHGNTGQYSALLGNPGQVLPIPIFFREGFKKKISRIFGVATKRQPYKKAPWQKGTLQKGTQQKGTLQKGTLL